ncbi:hypothetical protein Emed_004129 [Eimeria media]
MTQSVDLGDCIVKFEIWDTAGQERYRSLAPMRALMLLDTVTPLHANRAELGFGIFAAVAVAVAAVVVAAAAGGQQQHRESFEGAKSWVAELQAISDKSSLVMVLTTFFSAALAGNKTDLVADRVVKTQEAQQFAEEQGIFFMETSAKTGKNVNELFYEIVLLCAAAAAAAAVPPAELLQQLLLLLLSLRRCVRLLLRDRLRVVLLWLLLLLLCCCCCCSTSVAQEQEGARSSRRIPNQQKNHREKIWLVQRVRQRLAYEQQQQQHDELQQQKQQQHDELQQQHCELQRQQHYEQQQPPP